MITIESPKPEHIAHIIKNLKKEDKQEIEDSTGNHADLEILKALARPGKHYAACLNHEPFSLFGVADMNGLSRIGSPWMVSTDSISKAPIAFLKRSRSFLPALIEGYDYLVNMVDTRNKTSIEWLQWLGFKINQAEPYGVFNLPFHKFEMTIEHD